MIESAEKMWASWITGTQARRDQVVERPKLKGLILPDPRRRTIIRYLARATHTDDQEELVRAIYNLSHQARVHASGVELRWFDGLATNTLMLADPPLSADTSTDTLKLKLANEKAEPESESAWIQVETRIPYVVPSDRPGYRVYWSRHRELYNALLKAYIEQWNASTRPSLKQINAKSTCPTCDLGP